MQIHDEVSWVTSCRQLTGPERGLVQRRVECFFNLQLLLQYRLEPDNWELRYRLADQWVIYLFLFFVPAGTLNKQTVNINTNKRFFLNLGSRSHGRHVSSKCKSVDGGWCLSSVSLETSSHKTLREEERGYPVWVRRTLVKPVSYKLNTAKQIFHPAAKWLQTRITYTHPVVRNFCINKALEHSFELHRHDHSTLDCLLEIN